MESRQRERWQQLQAAIEPGFGRMLLVSVLIHLLVPVLYYTPLFPHGDPLKPPVYRVNLVNKPVKNPQAGRPEAVQINKPKPAPPAPKPKPVKAKPVPVKPPPKPKPAPASKTIPKPEPKPAPKPEPKPESKPTVSQAQENALEQRLKQMRAKLEREQAEQARQDRLAALKAAALAESQKESPIKDAPVGMVGGKGDEAGVDAKEFVAEFIRQQWSLSKYQIAGNPEAEVVMVYSAGGKLLHYRFLRKSGNTIFDDSLVRAINKSRQLNQPLPEQMDFDIVFNLKEMLDRP